MSGLRSVFMAAAALVSVAAPVFGGFTFEQGTDTVKFNLSLGGGFSGEAAATASRHIITSLQDQPAAVAEEVDFTTNPITFPTQSKQFPVSGSISDFKTLTLDLMVDPVSFTMFTPVVASLDGGANHVFSANVGFNVAHDVHFTGTYTITGPTQQATGHFDIVPQALPDFGLDVDTTNFPASVRVSEPSINLNFNDTPPIFSGTVDGVAVDLAFNSPSVFINDPNRTDLTPVVLTRSDTPEPASVLLAAIPLMLIRRGRPAGR